MFVTKLLFQEVRQFLDTPANYGLLIVEAFQNTGSEGVTFHHGAIHRAHVVATVHIAAGVDTLQLRVLLLDRQSNRCSHELFEQLFHSFGQFITTQVGRVSTNYLCAQLIIQFFALLQFTQHFQLLNLTGDIKTPFKVVSSKSMLGGLESFQSSLRDVTPAVE